MRRLFERLKTRMLTMLWSFEKMYYINIIKQELSTAKTNGHTSFDERSVFDWH